MTEYCEPTALPSKTNLFQYRFPFPHIFKTINLKAIFLIIFFAFSSTNDACSELRLTGRLNLNSATIGELMLLPLIGEVRSEAIWSFREKNGKFGSIESLLEVNGIGPKIVELLSPYIKLSGISELAIVDDGSTVISTGSSKVMASLLGNEALFTNLIDSIKEAREEIVISMFLFKTSKYKSNKAVILLETLAAAAKRGVKVSLLLENGRDTDSVTIENRKSVELLNGSGVVVQFDSPEKTTHTKVIVVDKKTVFVGSHNFTHSALKYNNELSARIDSTAFAQEVLAYIEGLR